MVLDIGLQSYLSTVSNDFSNKILPFLGSLSSVYLLSNTGITALVSGVIFIRFWSDLLSHRV